MVSRAWPWFLILLSFAASLWLAGSVALIDPDEGRNAEVAREMLAEGDLVIPRLAGMPYLDKPPALSWAAAAAMRVLGPTPFAARLPAAVAAALTLALVASLAGREAGRGFSLRVVALLATAPLFAVLSAYVIFDMPLALCVTVVWTTLARELADGAKPLDRTLLFVAITLGVLIKGPVMLAWALGGSLAAALLVRHRGPLRWLGCWQGWLLVLAVAGGWFALASARFPEYPRYAFLEETFERLTSGSFRREQPWWFVAAVLAGGALSWSLATPWWRLLEREPGVASDSSGGSDTRRVALGFILFAAVFFTLSRSKLVSYLLPALPPLAWLAAAAWRRAGSGRSAGIILFVLYAALAILSRAGPRLDLAPMDVTNDVAMRTWRAVALAFSGCAVVALVSAGSGRKGPAFAAALAFTPIVLGLGHPLLAGYARSSSGAPLAAAIVAAGAGPVRYQGCYSPGTDFLLARRGTLISDTGVETTSNYQLRYRASLASRGLWTPRASASSADRADVVVRPSRSAAPAGPGETEIFRDARFAAWHIESR